MTLCHPKMQPHTKFGIPSSNNIEKSSKHDYFKTRSEVKVTVTKNWFAPLDHPKMHPQTKFGTPTSKNIEVMHQTKMPILETRSEVKVTVTGKWNWTIRQIWDSYLK